MLIHKAYLVRNRCYIQNKTMKVKGLMLHSIGCACSKAQNIINNENRPEVSVAVHGVIDANSGDFFGTLPTALTDGTHSMNRTAVAGWHSGTGSKGKPNNANNTGYIGIEMCESEGIKYVGGATFKVTNAEKYRGHMETAYKSAVKIFAMLCDIYKLNPLTDIISHWEGQKRGIASNHSDPEHYWGSYHTMDGFRQDVLEELSAIEGKNEAPETDNFTPGMRISYQGNVYKEPPTFAVSAPLGVYTIVEVKNVHGVFWGRLKSGAGWVRLPGQEEN